MNNIPDGFGDVHGVIEFVNGFRWFTCTLMRFNVKTALKRLFIFVFALL